MTLEVLFAQAGQAQTFLLMVLCGAAMALAVHLAGFLHRISRWLGMGADLLCALGFAAAAGWIILRSGTGLRLYGLLGLCIGGTLYAGGIAPAAEWAGRLLCKGRHPANKQNTGG